MNTGMWTLVAWLCILGFVPVGTWLGWHYGLVEGKHRGKCAEKERQLAARQREAMRAPYAGPEIRAKTGPLPAMARAREPYPPNPRRESRKHMVTGELPRIDSSRMPVKRSTNIGPPAVTADDIAPVVVPEPTLTDTGELRAIGERGAAIRAAMVTGEHAWREKTGLQ